MTTALDHGRCGTHQVYGLTYSAFDQLRARAAGHCEMCGIAEADTKHGRLHIDHRGAYRDPASVRGLLCSPCNTGLGLSETGRRPFTAAERRFLAGVYAAPTAPAAARLPRVVVAPAETDPRPMQSRERLRLLAVARVEAARAEADVIVEALRLGIQQATVVRDVGRSREYVRRIAREAEEDGRLPRPVR